MDKTHPKIHGTTAPDVRHYVRFLCQGHIAYGLVKGDEIYELKGTLFDEPVETRWGFSLSDVELLAPCEPTKILGVGLNYSIHLGDRPRPRNPEMFFIPPSAALKPSGSIVIPPGTTQCEYEGELVVVIGKEAN